MVSQLSFKLKREYYDMCSFVQVMMKLDVIQSKNLLLQGAHKKEARIFQHPGM